MVAVGLAVTGSAGSTGSASPREETVGDRAVISTRPGIASINPEIAVTVDPTTKQARLHVVWEEGPELLHRWRDLPDGTWSAEREVFFFGQDPSLTVLNGSLVAAFTKTPSGPEDVTEVYTARWDGAMWSSRAVRTSPDEGGLAVTENGQQPDIAFDPMDGSLWLTWIDTSAGSYTPYYAQLSADGILLPNSDRLAAEENVQGPSVGVGAEGTVWAAWSKGYASGDEIIFLNSKPSGAGWRTEPRPLNSAAARGRLPDVATAADDVCVAWQESVDEAGANQEVFLDCRSASQQYNHSETAAGRSLEPRLALDLDLGALVVWQERNSGKDRDIEARQGPPPAEDRTRVDNGVVRSPSVVVHDRTAHAVWVSGSDADADVHYASWELAVPMPTPTATATTSATPRPSASATATGTPVVTRAPSATPIAGVTASPGPSATWVTPVGLIHVPFAESDRR